MEITPESGRGAPINDSTCPYVGLVAYHESDCDRFFGRDGEISSLLVRQAEHGDHPLMIIGPSGSGKSSLISAGLIPQLRRGAEEDEEELRIHTMVPTRFPLEALATALGSRQAQTDAESFALSTEQAVHLARVETGPTLLVVDQFEELFSLCTREDRQQAFARVLLDLASDEQARTTVVVAVRSESEDRLVALPVLHDLLRTGVLRLSALSPVNLRYAIERPANALNVGFEDGVVARLVEEIEGEFAPLPLLQFTMLALWQRRRDSIISASALEDIGGARRALEKAAEGVFVRLIPEEANCARRIFGRLVQADEGPGHGDFKRRRALRSELRSLEDPSRVDRVMQPFVSARLLSQRPIERDAVVEITHESLIRSWPRFSGWLEDSRLMLRQHAQLQEAMARWREGNRDPADLLSPGRIATFSALTELDAEEKGFLKRSAEHWRQVDLRKAARRRWIYAAIGLVAVLSAAGWWTAWKSRRSAVALQHRAEANATQADKQRDLTKAAATRATAQEQVAAGQRVLAVKARKEADLRTAKAVELQQKLEIARAKLRKDVVQGRELEAVEALVRLAERALPDFSALTRENTAATQEADAFDEARRGMKELTKLALRVHGRVDALDKIVNSKERQRDKETLKTMRLARLRVASMKKRLRWFKRQLDLRAKQLELAQRRRYERSNAGPSARARAEQMRTLEESLRRDMRRLSVLAGKRTTEADMEVRQATKKLTSTRRNPRERAIIMNLIGLAWYRAKRYPEAQKSFAAAIRGAVNGARRDSFVINRAWAVYRDAKLHKGAERAKLYRRTDKLLRDVERRDPRASRLRHRLHAESGE